MGRHTSPCHPGEPRRKRAGGPAARPLDGELPQRAPAGEQVRRGGGWGLWRGRCDPHVNQPMRARNGSTDWRTLMTVGQTVERLRNEPGAACCRAAGARVTRALLPAAGLPHGCPRRRRKVSRQPGQRQRRAAGGGRDPARPGGARRRRDRLRRLRPDPSRGCLRRRVDRPVPSPHHRRAGVLVPRHGRDHGAVPARPSRDGVGPAAARDDGVVAAPPPRPCRAGRGGGRHRGRLRWQTWIALHGGFADSMETRAASRATRRAISWVGTVGILARAGVAAPIGALIVLARCASSPARPRTWTSCSRGSTAPPSATPWSG